MKGVYRKRVNDLIQDIMLQTNERLGLIDRDNSLIVYKVSDNSIFASGTTANRLYGDLLIKRLELNPLMESPQDIDDEENEVLDSLENL